MLGITKKEFNYTGALVNIRDAIHAGLKYEFQFLVNNGHEFDNFVVFSKRLWKFPWQRWAGGGRW